jgi:hypothetical protein
MGDTKKNRGGDAPQGDALAVSLTRLRQTVRVRNSGDETAQGELPLESVNLVDQTAIDGLGTLEGGAMTEQCAGDRWNVPTEQLALYGMDDLRGLHRMLSERIVEANRDLARVARTDNLNSQEVRAVRDRLLELQAQRARLDAVIEVHVNGLKAHHRAETRAAAMEDGNEARGGLVKVRHPNRDFFLADLFDYALKDDGASMEAPIFTLATKPDVSIWEWKSRDGNKSVRVMPSVLGRATQHDKDVLIYVVSQMTEALNRGRADAKNRTVRFTVYDYLVTTNRGVGGDDYRRLQESFDRLAGTRIKTDIRTGGQRVTDNFGILDRVRIVEKSQNDERMVAVEVTLSEWLYNAVQALEVLTIHPDYFRLRKPLARRLYELARKHCGHQAQWKIGLELLQAKSGSKSTLKEFRRAVRAIEADNSMPEYRMALHEDDTVVFHSRDAKMLLASISKLA